MGSLVAVRDVGGGNRKCVGMHSKPPNIEVAAEVAIMIAETGNEAFYCHPCAVVYAKESIALAHEIVEVLIGKDLLDRIKKG